MPDPFSTPLEPRQPSAGTGSQPRTASGYENIPTAPPHLAVAPAGQDAGSIPRYRPSRFHARGGLGEVHVATDLELHREVALKCIQPAYLGHSSCRRRFLLEAEVTARLQHPGVVPIYGLVHDEAGHPWYAMRFIEGESLGDAIRRFHGGAAQGSTGNDGNPRDATSALDAGSYATAAFRQLLQRFIAVCNTIAYANNQGILHRDIKPANVMLGRYGETLVVDWGLAKCINPQTTGRDLECDPVASSPELLGARSDETLLGQAVGTPVFMSPEQAAGKWDTVGPASDIYSLGAMLYQLLTGKVPFRASGRDQLLADVQRGAFVPPRQVQPGIPLPLAAICLKAMANRPEDRYPSALDLAADIEQWLADEPVTACPEPLRVRLRRWARKHRTLVVSVLAALSVSAVAAIAAALLLGVKNRQLEIAYESEQVARTAAQTNEKLALDRKRLADENFALALDAVKDQVFDINYQLSPRPGTRDLREKLLQAATERLKTLVGRASEREDVDRTSIWAHFHLGDVYLDVDQRPSLAQVEYEKGYAIAQRLADARPGDAQALQDLYDASIKLGDTAFRFGYPEKSLAHRKQVLELAQKVAAVNPAEAPRLLALAYQRLGDSYYRGGQLEEAASYYTLYHDEEKKLADREAANPDAQPSVMMSLKFLGGVADSLGQPDRARDYYTQYHAGCKRAAAADPSNTVIQRTLAEAWSLLGDVALRAGQLSDARMHYAESHAITERLAEIDPSDSGVQREFSIACERLGGVCLKTAEPQRALEYFTQGLAFRRKLAEAEPADTQAQSDLALAYLHVGEANLQLQQTVEAFKHFTRALEVRQEAAKSNPESTRANQDLMTTLGMLGDTAFRAGMPEKAQQYYHQKLETSQRWAAANPHNMDAQCELLVSHGQLGDLASKTGRHSQALECYNRRLEISRKLAVLAPGRRSLVDLAVSCELAGETCYRLGNHEEAVTLFSEQVEIREKLVAIIGMTVEARTNLSIAYTRLGAARHARRDYRPARESYLEALSGLNALAAEGRTLPNHDAMVANLNQRITACDVALNVPPLFWNDLRWPLFWCWPRF